MDDIQSLIGDKTPGPEIAEHLRQDWANFVRGLDMGRGGPVTRSGSPYSPPSDRGALLSSTDFYRPTSHFSVASFQRAVVLGVVGDPSWFGFFAYAQEVELFQAYLDRAYILAGPNRKRAASYSNIFWGGLGFQVWGDPRAAGYLAELAKRAGLPGTALERVEHIGPLPRLFLALVEFERGRPDSALALLASTGVTSYQELGEAWNSPGGPAKALRGMLDYHKLAAGKQGHPYHYDYAYRWYEHYPLEVLAVLATRRRLGLRNPALDHPLLKGNPLFALPDGPVSMPRDPMIREMMDLVDFPACLDEDRAALERLPVSPLLQAPPPVVEKRVTDDQLAKLLVGRKSQVEEALGHCAAEIRWKFDGVETAQAIFSMLPDDVGSFEYAERRRVLKISLFGRSSVIEVWTVPEPKIADMLSPREVARRIGELMRPEYELRALSATLRDPDIIVIAKPAAFWAQVEQLDAKKAAKLLQSIPGPESEEPKKQRKKWWF
ncbi:MAG: hypothetical protein SF028_04810 [Candidatus Sumerlaeia bacterium]|nr:hypothetical protein [Candidatus Sumerlaeia bacterium]